jgi:hypothetical protein
MALLLIVFGVLVAGGLADFLYENDIATAATQPVTVAGTTVNLSTPVIAAIAFGMGVLAVLLIAAGIRRMRGKRRRNLEARIAQLEDENARLATKKNLPNVIKIPDSDAVVWSSDTPAPAPAATQAAPPPPSSTPPPPTSTQMSAMPEAPGSSPSTRW